MAPQMGHSQAVYKREDATPPKRVELCPLFIFFHRASRIECGNMSGSRDSGFDLGGLFEKMMLGDIQPRGARVRAKCLFVIYSGSRVEDTNEFYRYFNNAIERHIPRSKEKVRATVDVFGCKQIHDGVLHYLVAVRFSMRTNWRNAWKALAVYIDVDGKRVVDTSSIVFGKKNRRQSEDQWLEYVQEYVAKGGDTFGTWISSSSSSSCAN